MHSAPSVSYPVGRCAFQRWLLAGLIVLASGVLLAWVWQQGPTLVGCFAAGATLLGICQGIQAWRYTGTLTWDGHVWCLHDQSAGLEDALGEVQVALDVQKALLLRWVPTSDTLHAQAQWLWLGSQHSDNRWQDLRRAVYQRTNR